MGSAITFCQSYGISEQPSAVGLHQASPSVWFAPSDIGETSGCTHLD